MTSNIASASTTNRMAMPALNHAVELMDPKVPAVNTTTTPRMP
jgi:hypothetical protein